MIHHYCTLFDKYYITRGLALYESLKEKTTKFHLYIFAFDQVTYDVLLNLNLPHTTIISLEELEEPALLNVKPSRSKGEYCWTCKPFTIKYAITHYELSCCTFLDADLYFFSDPSELIDEMGDKSVLITEHRYPADDDQTKVSGIYCTQLIAFKNTSNGMNILNWWCNACLDWCYSWIEDGKFGDQHYLDDWPTRFKGILHVSQHLGSVAPWNISEYSSKNVKLIFYHFHELTFLKDNFVNLSSYHLQQDNILNIYQPYIKHLIKINQKLVKMDLGNTKTYHYIKQQHLSKKIISVIKKIYLCRPFKYRITYLLHLIKRTLKNTSNIYSLDKFN